MTALLSFDGVSLIVGGVRLLDRVDLVLRPGERVGIVGESGTGKSWLQRLAIGLSRPSSGSVRLMGERLDEIDGDRQRLLRARCGLTLQGGSLLGDHTVEDNMWLAFGAQGSRGARKVNRLLLDFGIEHLADARVDALSVGERRRVELARAFVRDPDLVILDEPFEGAFARANALEEQVRRRIVPHGRALLYLTQDAALAHRLCDRVLRLDRGRLVQQETAGVEPDATS